MRITDKEITLLRAIHDDPYQDGRTGQETVNRPVWSWSVVDTANLGTGAGGVMASLAKKGLVGTCQDPDDDDTVWLTQAGFDVLVSFYGYALVR